MTQYHLDVRKTVVEVDDQPEHRILLGCRSGVGYAFPPLGVPADLQSAVKKCPNLFMLWGYVIPSPQAVAGISMG